MYLKAKKQIQINGVIEPIIRFEVWFMTPFGLTDNYEIAVKQIIANDMDPELCLQPRSVAITKSTYEVVG